MNENGKMEINKIICWLFGHKWNFGTEDKLCMRCNLYFRKRCL